MPVTRAVSTVTRAHTPNLLPTTWPTQATPPPPELLPATEDEEPTTALEEFPPALEDPTVAEEEDPAMVLLPAALLLAITMVELPPPLLTTLPEELPPLPPTELPPTVEDAPCDVPLLTFPLETFPLDVFPREEETTFPDEDELPPPPLPIRQWLSMHNWPAGHSSSVLHTWSSRGSSAGRGHPTRDAPTANASHQVKTPCLTGLGA